MTDEKDESLSELLRRWEPPAVPDRLDERVLDAFRRERLVPRPSYWRRFLAAEVRIPLPLAAALVVALLLSGFLALRRPATPGTATAPAPAPVQAAHVAPPAVVTETSLSGFRPVEDVQVTVMGERNP